MNDKIRVLLADDHLHEREGLKVLLSLASDIAIVGEATSPQEAVQMAATLRPDVVLLDLVWYGDSTAGIAAIRRIKEEAPEVRIMAVTVRQDLIEESRGAGADVAKKDALFDGWTITSRIRDTYASPGLSAFYTERMPAEQLFMLSDRELQVLIELAKGKTDKEIARTLFISVPTVKKHVSSIFEKLGVYTRTGAVAIAYEVGIMRRGRTE